MWIDQTEGCGSWLYCVSTPPTHLIVVVPFIYNCRKIFSVTLPVFCINSCSANNCNFGVPVRGRELRVFLFCHLGHLFPIALMLRKFQGLKESVPRVMLSPFRNFLFFLIVVLIFIIKALSTTNFSLSKTF